MGDYHGKDVIACKNIGTGIYVDFLLEPSEIIIPLQNPWRVSCKVGTGV
jgi:hypothetical protein